MKRFVGETQFASFHIKQRLILFDQGIFRLGENGDQPGFVKRRECRTNGEPSDKFRDQAEFQNVVGRHLW